MQCIILKVTEASCLLNICWFVAWVLKYDVATRVMPHYHYHGIIFKIVQNVCILTNTLYGKLRRHLLPSAKQIAQMKFMFKMPFSIFVTCINSSKTATILFDTYTRYKIKHLSGFIPTVHVQNNHRYLYFKYWQNYNLTDAAESKNVFEYLAWLAMQIFGCFSLFVFKNTLDFEQGSL